MAVYEHIRSIFGFKEKPSDGAVNGVQLTSADQVVAFYKATCATTLPTLRVDATTYNPANNTTRSFPATPQYTIATNDYTAEPSSGSTSSQGMFSDGEVLIGLTVRAVAGTVQAPGRLWCGVFLTRKGQIIGQFIGDFQTASYLPTWIAGSPATLIHPDYDPRTAAKLFVFQGTVVNGAGGAGDQSLTVTAAAGSRVEIVSFEIINQDTAARATTLTQDDGSGNILLHVLQSAGSLAAAASLMFPQLGSVAGTSGNQGNPQRVMIAGTARLIATVAAVAASQDSAYSFVALVWGGAPTCTLAGASTPTLTTNVSGFLAG